MEHRTMGVPEYLKRNIGHIWSWDSKPGATRAILMLKHNSNSIVYLSNASLPVTLLI